MTNKTNNSRDSMHFLLKIIYLKIGIIVTVVIIIIRKSNEITYTLQVQDIIVVCFTPRENRVFCYWPLCIANFMSHSHFFSVQLDTYHEILESQSQKYTACNGNFVFTSE